MALIVAGGAVLVWPQGTRTDDHPGCPVHRRRLPLLGNRQQSDAKVSSADADFIAGTKGLAAGTTNLVLALISERRCPRLR